MLVLKRYSGERIKSDHADVIHKDRTFIRVYFKEVKRPERPESVNSVNFKLYLSSSADNKY